MKDKFLLIFISVSILLGINDSHHFRLYVTADVKGETEPCGWKKKPAGGLARKCTIVNNSKSAGFNTLVLDAGNLFFKQKSIDPGISLDSAIENTSTIIEAFNHIGCDAFSPGVLDFAAGVDFLNKLSKKSKFDFISCNIKDSNSNFLFKEYKIINHQNLNIGIIGATSVFELEGVQVEEPFSSISNTVSKIRDKCDVIILLFSASDSDFKILTTKKDLNADFIVRGNTPRKSTSGGSSAVPVYSVGEKGKVLYQFDLKYDSFDQPLIDIAYHEKIINTNTKRISRIRQNQSTDQYDKIKTYENNIQISRNIIENTQNSLQYKSIILNKTIQDDPYVLKIVDEGKQRLEEQFGPLPDPHRGHNHNHNHDHRGHSH